nr:hypothetical protein Iba_chr01aCG3060 [Ipomoea batatas]
MYGLIFILKIFLPTNVAKKSNCSDMGSTRGPSVVILVLRASPATAISSFDRETPTFPFSSSNWVMQEKHLSSEPLWVLTVWTNWYLDRLRSDLLFESKMAAPPIRNKQFGSSIDFSFPKYQFNPCKDLVALLTQLQEDKLIHQDPTSQESSFENQAREIYKVHRARTSEEIKGGQKHQKGGANDDRNEIESKMIPQNINIFQGEGSFLEDVASSCFGSLIFISATDLDLDSLIYPTQYAMLPCPKQISTILVKAQKRIQDLAKLKLQQRICRLDKDPKIDFKNYHFFSALQCFTD